EIWEDKKYLTLPRLYKYKQRAEHIEPPSYH
ncbi:unnamed protein product, partial [marine sediment metagenome]